MALIIPETINGLSMAEAFCYYRDALAWQVYPVHPPWAKVTDPGKHPAVSKWWEFDPHDCDVGTRFGSRSPFNIGLAPKNGLVIVDLDSKPDKGASVQTFLASHPEIANTPRHVSRNGGHLIYFCPDLPKFMRPNGKPYYDKLVTKLKEPVTVELFHSDHSNVVMPPSRHPLDEFIYAWTLFGEIRTVEWKWLQDTFGFTAPPSTATKAGRKKAGRWFEGYRGDLNSLDLVGLLETLGHPGRLLDQDEGKYAVLCPWAFEHTTKKDVQSDTATVIWQLQDDQSWPAFKCQHSHCAGRGLEQLLEWAEGKEPGIVDRFCSRERTWQPGQKSRQGRPRVLHAQGRLESEVYEEVGRIIGPKHDWFRRGDQIVAVRKVPSGFIYSDNPDTRYSVESFQVGLGELSALQAKSSLEKYMEPGYLSGDPPQFIPCSFATEFCAGLLQAEQLKNHLFHIVRILPVPLPFRSGDKLIYPKSGYDPRFGTYLLPGHPVIKPVPFKTAVGVLERLHEDFCFTNDQSRTHAIAALLTPFSRALIDWTTRTPLWFYCANRPRAGKDYLRAITLLVYEGHAFEDLPIGKESEETAKRIMAAARSGRRFMHFSNCQAHLQDAYLTQVLTNRVISGRRLGSNDASSDLSLPNEIEFSLSANVGLTFREDFEPRMRKIELAYFEEDPNERKFKNKFLHRTVLEHRALILSSIASVFNHWAQQGFPEGKTDFISYPEWAHTIGGVMNAANLGDPCLVFTSSYETGGDLKTAAMKALFELCFKVFGDAWVIKSQIYQAVHNATEQEGAESDSALGWFGPMEGTEDARSNQTKLGMQLRVFKKRFLGGIQLQIDESSARSIRHRYRFIPTEKPPQPAQGTPQEMVDTLDTLDTSNGSSRAREKNPNRGEEVCVECIELSKNEPLQVSKVSKVSTLDTLSGDILAFDLETCAEVKVSRRGTPKIRTTAEALNPFKGQIRLLTLADSGGNIRSFDLREGTLPDEIRAALESSPLVIHNAGFDLLFLSVQLGIAPRAVFCTLTASRLLLPSRTTSHNLGSTLERYLGVKLPKEHGSSDWGAFVLTEAQLAYAHDDVRHLHKLEATLRTELENAQLEDVFELEMNLVPIVVAMEHHGFSVDRARLEQIRSNALGRAGELSQQLRNIFGLPTLNPASPVELLEAFKAAGIELPNTEESTLSAFQDDRVALLLAYREAAKLEASAKTLLKAVGADGRIHARFNPVGSLAGRFSSKGPNLQNVTRGPLRECFIPSGADRCLLVADYSQIELRIGAYFAKDEAMLKAFGARKDLHRATAAAVLSKPLSEITKADRQLAKAVNFGFLYGQQAKGFRTYARTQYGILLDLEQAAGLRAKFFSQYHGLAKWHHAAWQKAQEGIAEARTVLGRRLLAQTDRDWDRFQLHTNYTVQGSAADVIKRAMIRAKSVLSSDVRLVATVHDELVFDCPTQEAPHYAGVIRAVMEDAFGELFPELPIEVEAKECAHWGEK